MDKSFKVLLIEDFPGDARLIHENLKGQADDIFELDWVDHLSTGVEYLGRERFDAVLLDLCLPDSQGADTFIRLKNSAPQVPIVILSGISDEELAARLVKGGAQDYLVKGKVEPELLRRSIRYAIERKLTEVALAKNQEMLRAALELGRIGSWEYDLETQVTTWSEQAYVLYERDMKLGPPSPQEEADYYSAAQAKALSLLKEQAIQTGGIVSSDIEVSLTGPKTVYYHSVLQPVKDDKGRIIKLIGTIQDITERKHSEAKTLEVEAMKKVNQAKSEMLANVSHELRTPLASIKGCIESLIEPDVKWSPQQQSEFLQTANQEADRLTYLIRDLLDMSRLDSGKMPLERCLCQVQEILDSVSGVLAVIAAKNELRITRLPYLPMVEVDRVRIGQVITNLVENATKFSAEGSLIEISAFFKDGQVVISVEDNGIGMPPSVVANLFDRFYQAKQVVIGKTRGTGLGLAICRGIIQAHGGKIWVESQEGKGSKFYFSLPVGEGERSN